MPKGKKVLTYAQQEALCRAFFQLIPDLDPKVLIDVVKKHYGVTMTWSEVMAGQRFALNVPKAPHSLKDEYVVAHLTLRPDLPLSTLDQYTQWFFGMATRDETFMRCQRMAKELKWTEAHVREVIAKCEQKTAPPPQGFDLRGEA